MATVAPPNSAWALSGRTASGSGASSPHSPASPIRRRSHPETEQSRAQPCDNCRKRKKKCIRETGVCSNCASRHLLCTTTERGRNLLSARAPGAQIARLEESTAVQAHFVDTYFTLVAVSLLKFRSPTLQFQFHQAGCRIEALPPREQCLALLVMAFGCYVRDFAARPTPLDGVLRQNMTYDLVDQAYTRMDAAGYWRRSDPDSVWLLMSGHLADAILRPSVFASTRSAFLAATIATITECDLRCSEAFGLCIENDSALILAIGEDAVHAVLKERGLLLPEKAFQRYWSDVNVFDLLHMSDADVVAVFNTANVNSAQIQIQACYTYSKIARSLSNIRTDDINTALYQLQALLDHYDKLLFYTALAQAWLTENGAILPLQNQVAGINLLQCLQRFMRTLPALILCFSHVKSKIDFVDSPVIERITRLEQQTAAEVSSRLMVCTPSQTVLLDTQQGWIANYHSTWCDIILRTPVTKVWPLNRILSTAAPLLQASQLHAQLNAYAVPVAINLATKYSELQTLTDAIDWSAIA